MSVNASSTRWKRFDNYNINISVSNVRPDKGLLYMYNNPDNSQSPPDKRG